MTIDIKTFFDSDTSTFTHVVSDPNTKKCAIIDSVLDYDQYSGRTKTKSAEKVISYVNQEKLSVDWILETHIHADHITASHYLKEKLGGKFETFWGFLSTKFVHTKFAQPQLALAPLVVA